MNKECLGQSRVCYLFTLLCGLSALVVVDACGGDSSDSRDGRKDSGIIQTGKDSGVSGQDGGACALTLCQNGCVDVMHDNSNCGKCGKVCGATTHCFNGDCTSSCDPNAEQSCGGHCVSITDSSNCGTCGTVCGNGFYCDPVDPKNNHCLAYCASPHPDYCGPGPVCVDFSSDPNHCSGCTTHCDSAKPDCFRSLCRPSNDVISQAVVIPTAATLEKEQSFAGSTVNATASADRGDAPAPPSCVSASNPNVWYQFTTTNAAELVYADTLGSAIDTQLYFAYSNGVPIGPCSDDACGEKGAQIIAYLGPGTYYVVVSSSTPGDFTLHFQHMPYTVNNYGSPNGQLSGTGNTPKTDFGGTPHRQPACLAATNQVHNGEDAYWLLSCGNQATLLSLCRNGGYWEYITGNTNIHNPVLDVVSGLAGRDDAAWCNDNGISVPGGCGINGWGSEINTILPRGLNIVTISDHSTLSGMHYIIAYDVH